MHERLAGRADQHAPFPRLDAARWIGLTALAWAIALFAVHYGEQGGTLPLVLLLPLAVIGGMGMSASKHGPTCGFFEDDGEIPR